MPPAVKGVQQAHGGALALRRASLDNRADEYLSHPAADGVQHNRNHQPRHGRQNARQNRHAGQAQYRQHMRRNDADAVADAVNELGAEQVNEQLHGEIHRRHHRYLFQRQRKFGHERHKQQRREVIDNRLRDVAQIAGGDGMAIGQAGHGCKLLCEIHCHDDSTERIACEGRFFRQKFARWEGQFSQSRRILPSDGELSCDAVFRQERTCHEYAQKHAL